MNTQFNVHPSPSPQQEQHMRMLCSGFITQAEDIQADSSAVVSAALSIVGSVAISTPNQMNKRAIVASLRGLADLIESGQLSADSRMALASAKASTLH